MERANSILSGLSSFCTEPTSRSTEFGLEKMLRASMRRLTSQFKGPSGLVEQMRIPCSGGKVRKFRISFSRRSDLLADLQVRQRARQQLHALSQTATVQIATHRACILAQGHDGSGRRLPADSVVAPIPTWKHPVAFSSKPELTLHYEIPSRGPSARQRGLLQLECWTGTTTR